MALIFDIETVGENWDEIDEITRSGLIKSAQKRARGESEADQSELEAKNSLGLSPLTGKVITIGMIDSETGNGAVLFLSPGQELEDFEEDGIKFVSKTEKEMLSLFWTKARSYTEFVTYSGRSFDVPFIVIRSIACQIKPTVDLMSNRYLNNQFGVKHYDLQDLLTFYGATSKMSLHLVCRAFGIDSPKGGGVGGNEVGRLFQEQKFLEIARYNARDIVATNQLFAIYRSYFKH